MSSPARDAGTLRAGAARVVARTGPGHRETAPAVVAAALGLAEDELELGRDVRGRPVVRFPATDLRLSVAHTSGLTVIALALGIDVGIDVGVDVERLDRDVTAWTLWEQILTAEEAAHLPQERAARNATLLQFWVRREALLKAVGVGLAVEPQAIELAADGRIVGLPSALGTPAEWSLEDLAIRGCAAAIACRPVVTALELQSDCVFAPLRSAPAI